MPVPHNCLAILARLPAGAALRPDAQRHRIQRRSVIQAHIGDGISLTDALNAMVEKFDLVRIDRRGFTGQAQLPLVNAIDILRARRACGLMTRAGYREVTRAIQGGKRS